MARMAHDKRSAVAIVGDEIITAMDLWIIGKVASLPEMSDDERRKKIAGLLAMRRHLKPTVYAKLMK